MAPGSASQVGPKLRSNAARSALSSRSSPTSKPEPGKAGGPGVGDAAGHDAREVLEVRRHVDAEAVRAHPAAQAHADGGDLVVAALSRPLPPHPDADAAAERLALHAQLRQGIDDQPFQRRNVGAHVAEAATDVEHDIADALSGTMIGVLAAATGAVDGKASPIQEIAVSGAGAGRVERGVLQQPDQLARGAGSDGIDAGGHDRASRLIGHKPARDEPFDGRVGAFHALSLGVAATLAEAQGLAPGGKLWDVSPQPFIGLRAEAAAGDAARPGSGLLSVAV